METVNIIQLDKSRWQEYKDLRIFAVQESPEAFSTTPSEEEEREDKYWINRLEENIDINNMKILFAEYENKIVGMVGIHFHHQEKIKHIGEIGSVFVLPEYRGKGISKKLLEQAILIGREKVKIEKVVLEVTVTQTTAIALYKKLGFRTVGTLKDELKIGNRYLDHLYMEKLLK
jgi:RimJ/RimL family protein N-acetyltransferase